LGLARNSAIQDDNSILVDTIACNIHFVPFSEYFSISDVSSATNPMMAAEDICRVVALRQSRLILRAGRIQSEIAG
jgi:hypothetical protein